MLQCYNRGCGQMFDPAKNEDDSCRHHPGMPFFHDAYKGWSCCNRKSVDFTEFLNMKGCTLSTHSNEKPPEPEKPPAPVEVEEEVPRIRKPIATAMERPPFDTSLIKLTPTVLPALKEAVDSLVPKVAQDETDPDIIEIGTICKNGGCQCSYSSPDSDESECQYHPGVPIFHEGLKFWSCCQKRTTDFTAFVNQVGCAHGKHKWRDEDNKREVNCRYDWHQTPSNVIVAIYAKLYHYERSSVEMNPVRLKVDLVFPDQNDDVFSLDLELRGIVDVQKSTVKMFSTKVEITMPKAEASTWPNLNFPKIVQNKDDEKKKYIADLKKLEDDSDSDVDLDDIEPIR